MRIAVDFQDERLDFEVADDRVVGHRPGPERPERPDARAMALGQLGVARRLPPLARAVVPGDRVVIPLDPASPDLAEVLGRSSPGPSGRPRSRSITVVSTAPGPAGLPEGVDWEVHDPDDRAQHRLPGQPPPRASGST